MATPYDRREYFIQPQDNFDFWEMMGPSWGDPLGDGRGSSNANAGGGSDEPAPSPPVEELPQLPEVIVVAPISPTPPLVVEPIAPPFQGPLPEPSPAPGGGGASTPTTTTTTQSDPQRSPYRVEKPGLLRTARFIIEQLLSRIAPAVRNILPRMPSPLTFVGEALLIGDKVADATLFDPRTTNQTANPDYFADTYTSLEEQTVWAPSSPSPNQLFWPSTSGAIYPSLNNAPVSLLQPAPYDLPLPIPSFETNSPLPSSVPSLGLDPSPLLFEAPLASPSISTMTMEPAPLTPTMPSTSAPPWTTVDPVASWPSLDTPTMPGSSLAPEPTPFAQPSSPRSRTCPPCKKEGKKQEKRTKCYVTLVKQRTDPTKDTTRKWREIKCR